MNPAIIVCSARQFFPKILAFDRSNGKILFMSKKRIKLSDQIRRAVDASGISRYRISKELGISESTMSRFMAGLGGLSMEYLDALADLLEMNLAAVKPKRLAEKPTRATPRMQAWRAAFPRKGKAKCLGNAIAATASGSIFKRGRYDGPYCIAWYDSRRQATGTQHADDG